MMTKMSRTDILTAAICAGWTYEDALELAYELSPECGLVSAKVVYRRLDPRRG